MPTHLAATLGEAMTPVELARAVAWGVLFALFAYERWKTPLSVLDERDLVSGVGTDHSQRQQG